MREYDIIKEPFGKKCRLWVMTYSNKPMQMLLRQRLLTLPPLKVKTLILNLFGPQSGINYDCQTGDSNTKEIKK